MAGDWIKMQKSTSAKPEVWAIADALGIDPDAVVGKLFRVWCWFDDQTENGHAPSVTKNLLDRDVGVVGFCDAMQSVGWMIDDGETITMPNFDRHNGESAKKRALAAERQRKVREKNNAEVTDASRNERDTSVTREEKRREEKNNKKPNVAKKPCDPYSQDFESLWQSRPRRSGTDNKREAWKAYLARLNEGVTHDEMQAGVDAYRRWLKAEGKEGTEFVKMTSTFLGPNHHFRDEYEVEKPKAANPYRGYA